MATPARLAGVGLFVLTGVLLFATGLFMIGERQLAFARKFVVYTEFKTVTGLQPGAIVRVSGAPAGSVTDIEPPADPSGKFRARLRSPKTFISSCAPTLSRRSRPKDLLVDCFSQSRRDGGSRAGPEVHNSQP